MARLSIRKSTLAAVAATALLAPAAMRAAETGAAVTPRVPARSNPIVVAAPATFEAAVAAVEKAAEAKAEKLPFGDVPLAEGRSFAVQPSIAERLLEGSHVGFKKAGFYLFRYERSFGMAGEKDRLGLLKTADHRVVLARVGTQVSHHQLDVQRLLGWLDALAKEEPFDLWEVGTDYLAGRFEQTPKDPAAIARRCAEFAPDLVAGRASTLDLLATEIRTNRTLYLIW